MKKLFILLAIIMIANFSIQANKKTVNLISAGTLATALSSEEQNSVDTLIISGKINQTDFLTMNSMSTTGVLKVIDLNGTNVEAVDTYSANEIPKLAFENCLLTELILPNSIVSIENEAFIGCKKLDSIMIPSSVNKIGDNVFSDCDSLRKIIVDNSNSSFLSESNVLFNKNKTTLIKYPSNIKNDNYDIPNTVNVIKSGALYKCPFKTITVPNSVDTVYGGAFNSCVFSTITLPNVKYIGERAFSANTYLTSISLPNTLNYIGMFAFAGTGLASIDLPSSIDTIRLYSFYNCYSLSSVKISNTVKSIQNSAFNNCWNLSSVEINGTTLESIGQNAFKGCSKLNSITLPSSLKSIGVYAFSETFLSSITIPNGVTTIETAAFSNCTNLSSATFNNPIKRLPNSIFWGCTSLTNLTIPNTLTYIEEGALSTTGLTTITIPESVDTIAGSAFQSCSNLISIKIPNSVKYIGNSVFNGCKNLSSVSLPNSIQKIEMSTFSGCSKLTSIIIPVSITELGMSSFGGCSKLDTIICSNTNAPETSNGFAFMGMMGGGISATAKTYCPEASVSSYSTASFPNPTALSLSLPLSVPNLISSASNNEFITVTSNTIWTATSDQSWLIVTSAGKFNGNISLSSEANNSSSTRSATITVKGLGVSDKTISVTQNGETATTISNSNQETSIKFYPNPATDKITISVSSESSVILTNQLGQVVLIDKVSETKTIDVSSLSRGIYFLKIGNTQQKVVLK